MKTISITLAIFSAVSLAAQDSPPSLDWNVQYRINDTYSYGMAVDNDNKVTIMATDYLFDEATGESVKTFHLLKLNGSSVESSVPLSVPGSTDSYHPYKLVVSSDNGYLTTNENDGTVQKYAANGSLLWSKSFGNDFYTDDGIRTNDGNLIVVGANNGSVANFYYLIRKMDNNGSTIWENKANKLNGMYFEPTKIAQTQDNGYIMGGVYVNNFNSEYPDGYNLVKMDAVGNITWEKRFPVPANVETWPMYLLQNSDGSYVMGLEYDDDNAETSGDYIAKFDSSGNLIWSKWMGESKYIGGLVKGTDNGYVLNITDNEHEYFLRKINESGDADWEYVYGNFGYTAEFIKASDGFISLNNFYDNESNANLKILKFGLGGMATVESAQKKIVLYPNPATDILNVRDFEFEKAEIFDASGRMVKSLSADHSGKININDLSNGNYILKLEKNGKTKTATFIKK